MNNKHIAMSIVRAQMCSDCGKGRTSVQLSHRGFRYAKTFKYDRKVEHIISAIQMIAGSRRTGFSYYCVAENDQNGYPSILVYFEFPYNGGIQQVSFHTLRNLAKDLARYVGTGKPTEWNHEFGGSLRACQILVDLYKLN